MLKNYVSIWSRIAPNGFDTRACKSFAKSLNTGENIDALNGQKCVDFLIKNLDKAIEISLPPLRDDQCDNTLQEESKEIMVSLISKCFTTDRGIILLENHMMFFQDAHTFEQKEAWFKETMDEWSGNLHSSMVEEFQTALRLWMLSK